MMCCCVPLCKSKRGSCEKITFHEFPSDPEERFAWLKNISRKDWTPGDRSVVCSRHFKEEDYKVGLKTKCLKPGAVPSVFRNYSNQKSGERKTVKHFNLENGPNLCGSVNVPGPSGFPHSADIFVDNFPENTEAVNGVVEMEDKNPVENLVVKVEVDAFLTEENSSDVHYNPDITIKTEPPDTQDYSALEESLEQELEDMPEPKVEVKTEVADTLCLSSEDDYIVPDHPIESFGTKDSRSEMSINKNSRPHLFNRKSFSQLNKKLKENVEMDLRMEHQGSDPGIEVVEKKNGNFIENLVVKVEIDAFPTEENTLDVHCSPDESIKTEPPDAQVHSALEEFFEQEFAEMPELKVELKTKVTGNQVELHPGSDVWVSARMKRMAILKSKGRPSKLVNLCLNMLFTKEQLANFSVHGQRKHPGIPQKEANAVKEFVLHHSKRPGKQIITDKELNKLLNRSFGMARKFVLQIFNKRFGLA